MKYLLAAYLTFFSMNLFAISVDLKKSEIKWLGKKVTGKHNGKINLKQSSLNFTEDGLIKSGDLIIDMHSITVEDLEGEWATKFLTHIKSSDFFEVEKFPIAKLVVKKDDGKKIEGVLNIKDKSAPVKFDYKKTSNTLDGKLVFDRTKFNMKYGSGNFFKDLGDKMIDDDVEITFKVVLIP